MEFHCKREDLINSLKKIQGIVEKNPVIPIASNLLLEAKKDTLVLRATNFEVGIIVENKIPIVKDGEIIIDAQKFFEIVREMPDGEISLKRKDDGWVEIKHGTRILFNLAVLADEQYPPVKPDDKIQFVEIEAGHLSELIQKTVYACSDDRTRDVLRGILLEQNNSILRMVATDGHRLALAEREILKGDSVTIERGTIIPRKGAKEIKRLAQELEAKDTVEVGFGEKNITVRKGEETLIIRLIEGDFPDYKRVIPQKNTKKLLLKERDLLESLKRVMLITEEETRAVTFSVKKGFLTILSKKAGTGDVREEREVDYDGEEFDFSLNSRYMLDVLGALEGEKISLEVEDSSTPILIKEADREDVIAVVMPMML